MNTPAVRMVCKDAWGTNMAYPSEDQYLANDHIRDTLLAAGTL